MTSLLLSHWIPVFSLPSSPSSNCLMDQNVRSSHPSIRQSKHQPRMDARREEKKERGEVSCFQRSQIRRFPKLVLRYQCLQMWVWHEKEELTEAMAFIDTIACCTDVDVSQCLCVQCLCNAHKILWLTPTENIIAHLHWAKKRPIMIYERDAHFANLWSICSC